MLCARAKNRRCVSSNGDALLGSFFSHPAACYKFGVVLEIFKLDLPPIVYTPKGAQAGYSNHFCSGWAAREAIQLNAEGIIQPVEIIEEPNLGPAALQTASLLVGRLSNVAVAEISARSHCSQPNLRRDL